MAPRNKFKIKMKNASAEVGAWIMSLK